MTHTRADLNEEKIEFRQKYIAEKLSLNGRNSRTAMIRRLEDNRQFWRGVFVGDGKGRRQ